MIFSSLRCKAKAKQVSTPSPGELERISSICPSEAGLRWHIVPHCKALDVG